VNAEAALAEATVAATEHQAPVDVWEHIFSGRQLSRPASKEPIAAPGWRKVVRVQADGSQVAAADLPADEVLPPDDFTVPTVLTPSEAVFAFAAWLTTRKTPVVFSAKDDAAVVAALVGEFCQVQGLVPPRDLWANAIKTMPLERIPLVEPIGALMKAPRAQPKEIDPNG
jgi:hypothetical protein